VVVQEGYHRHNSARNAEATLNRTRLDERLLHRVQFTVSGQPFNGQHVAPVDLPGQNQARIDRLAVQQHCTRTALTFAAAVLGSRQT
jgi:hypothetical protein